MVADSVTGAPQHGVFIVLAIRACYDEMESSWKIRIYHDFLGLMGWNGWSPSCFDMWRLESKVSLNVFRAE